MRTLWFFFLLIVLFFAVVSMARELHTEQLTQTDELSLSHSPLPCRQVLVRDA